MVTIEDKIRLFAKMIYEKVDRENQAVLSRFENEIRQLMEEKKQEFTREAEEIWQKGRREIQKRVRQIISQARMDEKRMLWEKRQLCFAEMVDCLLDYAKEFVHTGEYGDLLWKELPEILSTQNKNHVLELYLTSWDLERFAAKIELTFAGYNLRLQADDSLVGGFVLIDREQNVKIDMSFVNRIQSAKDLITEQLYGILQ